MSQPAIKQPVRRSPKRRYLYPCVCAECCAADPARAALKARNENNGKMTDLRGRPR